MPFSMCWLYHDKIQITSTYTYAGEHTFSFQKYAGLGGLQPLQRGWQRAFMQLITLLCRPTPAAVLFSNRGFSQHCLHSAASVTEKVQVLQQIGCFRCQGCFFSMFSEQQSVQASLKGLKSQYLKGHLKSRQFCLETQLPCVTNKNGQGKELSTKRTRSKLLTKARQKFTKFLETKRQSCKIHVISANYGEREVKVFSISHAQDLFYIWLDC